MNTRRTRVLVAMCLLSGLAACGPTRSSVPIGYVSFNADCDDALCGFRATQGAIDRVEHFAPGEFAMRVQPQSVAEGAFSFGLPSTEEYVSFAMRCDVDTTMRVTEVAYVWRVADDGTLRPTTMESSRVLASRHSESLPMARVFATFDARQHSEHSQRVLLRFEPVGAGGCVVDEITLESYESQIVR